MRFEYGHWEVLPGTEAIYPLHITDVQLEDDALVIMGYDHVVDSRWSVLHGSIITARFSSPMPNVIRVQLTHFKGRQAAAPAFDLDYEQTNPDVEIGRDEAHAWLKTGDLAVIVPTDGEWQFRFERDGKLLTASEPKAVGLFNRDNTTYIREQLTLQVGEMVYGLGERFGPFAKNGQTVDIWHWDGGTDSEYAYKNVPFYLTSQGYGVLVNHPGAVSYEVASHNVQRVQFSVEEHALDYYIFGGPTPKDALTQYTALSGRPAQLPAWSFGLWLSTSFTTNYNEKDILANIERMEALGIPIGV
ncbi:MAG: alpha-xylosidase, partial [Anaerolineae bacterium]|nr:alpha-xylosidase [Anaerolineae bacterium]